MQKPWTGDLDGMIERRVIRVLTVNSKTFYFVDKGVQRGTVVDFFRLFEDELNKKLAAEKKLKNKNLKVRVVFIPVRRDQLLPALAAGKGDIAAANLTITPERQKLVDFTAAGHEQRERGRGDGAGVAEDRQPGRSLRQGSLRAQVVELLREPRRAQQEVRGREEAAGHAQGSPRDAGGRGPARDAQRRPRSARRRRQAHRGLLEADLPEAHRARRRRGSHRRRDRLGDPQGQPAAQGGAGRFRHAQQGRDLDRQPAPDALPEERQVREERGLRGGAQEVPGAGPVFPEVRRPVRRGLGADGRAGLPGVAAQPEREEPGGRDRRHAADARHRQGHEGGRHHARPRRTSTPASSTCAA